MARTRRNLDEQGEGDALRERLRQQRPGWQRERLLAVQWGWEGELSLEQIAAQLGRARSSIQLWFDAFRRGGAEALPALHRDPSIASSSPKRIGPAFISSLTMPNSLAIPWRCFGKGMVRLLLANGRKRYSIRISISDRARVSP